MDAATSETVENYIINEVKNKVGVLKAVVWITHSPEQGKRVGTRFLRVTAGGMAYCAPNKLHGFRNVGDVQAQYFVVKIGNESVCQK